MDSGKPTSRMDATIAELDSTTFLLRWSGRDDSLASGIGGYSIYLKQDAHPYQLFLADVPGTQLVSILPRGHHYAFFTRAKDHAGNEEPMKGAGEAAMQLEPIVSVSGAATPPVRFVLHPNSPNPFSRETQIRFELPRAARVSLSLYDIGGRRVKTILNQEKFLAGRFTVPFNARELSTGIYFYRIQAGDFVQARKMTILR